MTRPVKKSLFVASFVTALFGGVVLIGACSQQKEGEVCSTANGNDDCDTDNNLQCDPAVQLNNVTSDRCCPIDRTKATHPACINPTNVGTSDAAAPGNTTVPDSGTSNASDAGSTDAADQ